jgi:predicted house-cleaning noncanonical NTP pyrophosphatase (MazG superfamily)
MNSPATATERIAKSTEMVKNLLDKMSVEAILQFREDAKRLHAQQLEVITEILKSKGHIEGPPEPPPNIPTKKGG